MRAAHTPPHCPPPPLARSLARPLAHSQAGGCTPTFILFLNGVKVFDYSEALRALGELVGRPHLVPRHYRGGEPFVDFDCSLFDLPLAGNVQIQVHSQHAPGKGLGKRTMLAGAWFHTGFIA